MAIIWAETETGARIPLDARPAVVYTIDATELLVQPKAVPAGPRLEGAKTYISHFLTCKHANEFTNGKRPAPRGRR